MTLWVHLHILFLMNTLKQALDRRGLSVRAAAKKGVPYCTLYQQYNGRRRVGAVCAVRYEERLGIPRSELRPDLWPPAQASAGGVEP